MEESSSHYVNEYCQANFLPNKKKCDSFDTLSFFSIFPLGNLRRTHDGDDSIFRDAP